MTTATANRLNFQGIEEGGSGSNAPNQGHNGGNMMARRAAFTLTNARGQAVQVWLTCSDDTLLEPLAHEVARADLHLPSTA